jgi:predicted extracellular nuclease
MESQQKEMHVPGQYLALLALSLALGLIFALSALAAPEEEGARSPAAGPAASAPGDTHTIYQIQYTTNPGSGNTYPSPVAGQVVTTSGTVCAVYKRGYVINEDTGPWHGVYVYVGPSGAKPAQGTLVQVTGAITEYQGMTEFSYPTRVRQMGEGPNVCTPTVIAAAAVPYNNPALAEPYEGTIVEYRNITITSIGTYSALFVDGSGAPGPSSGAPATSTFPT